MDEIFGVYFSDYSKKHYLKEFQKKYKGKVWFYTEESIKQDLARLGFQNNTTQRSTQIDELKYKDNNWLAKYDFRIAGSKFSPKDSGNRCVVHIDGNKRIINILMIYNKNNLPKNKGETEYIYDVINKEFKDLEELFVN